MSPVWQQKKLREFCKANGIVLTAFSPLGAIGCSWGTNHVMENEVLQEIAKARGKTVAQVLFNISSNWKDCKHQAFNALGKKEIIYIYIHTHTQHTHIRENHDTFQLYFIKFLIEMEDE
jgi:diketogulonate reductase-like aldo/keto reductase